MISTDASAVLKPPRISMHLNGNVDYIDDWQTCSGTFRPPQPAAMLLTNGVNELFEETAVAWHRMDPEGCEACSNMAGECTEGRGTSLQKRKKTDADVAPAPAPQPMARPTLAAPADYASDQARRDWAAWWREDAVAAEAFLNTADWPAELKSGLVPKLLQPP